MAPSVADLPVSKTIVSVASNKTETGKSLGVSIVTRDQLESAIRAQELIPLWGAMVSQPEPGTKHIPAVWKYEHTKALLLKAGEMVDPKEAERRALLHINPGPRQPPFTLDTILSAHQLLLPGERALCHRHTAFAVRFLIEGEKGQSA
jgi:gentisate 1,2-dioxygenase